MTSTRTAPAAVVLAFRVFLGYAALAFVGWAWLSFNTISMVDHFADLRSDHPVPDPPLSNVLACAGGGALIAAGPTALVIWAAIRMRAGSNVARGSLLALTGVQVPIAVFSAPSLVDLSTLWEFGAPSVLALGFAVAGSIAMFRDSVNAYFLDPRLSDVIETARDS